MSLLSSSNLNETNKVGNYYELKGEDGRSWKLYAVVDENDMKDMPYTTDDVNEWAFRELENDGYKLSYNGYIPIPFVSFPLVSESPKGVVSGSDCLWCYCVNCGGMLAGKSVMALQIMVGVKEIIRTTKTYQSRRSAKKCNKRKKKSGGAIVIRHEPYTFVQTKNTYLPRLLCSKCHEPEPSHTMYPLIALCFESLDSRVFKLMTNYEKNYPLDKTLKYVQAEEYKQSQKKYCCMCGTACSGEFCSEECNESHVYLVRLKKDMEIGDEQIHEDDESMKQKIVTKEFSEITEEYVKDMLTYFKRERLNVNKRLRPPKCQNPLCKEQAKKIKHNELDCCSRCNRASYCSKNCQKTHFEQHRPTCNYWKDVWDVNNLVTLKIPKRD